jgi:hypothetical protein
MSYVEPYWTRDERRSFVTSVAAVLQRAAVYHANRIVRRKSAKEVLNDLHALHAWPFSESIAAMWERVPELVVQTDFRTPGSPRSGAAVIGDVFLKAPFSLAVGGTTSSGAIETFSYGCFMTRRSQENDMPLPVLHPSYTQIKLKPPMRMLFCEEQCQALSALMDDFRYATAVVRHLGHNATSPGVVFRTFPFVQLLHDAGTGYRPTPGDLEDLAQQPARPVYYRSFRHLVEIAFDARVFDFGLAFLRAHPDAAYTPDKDFPIGILNVGYPR